MRGAWGNLRPYRDASKEGLREVVIRRIDAGSRPMSLWGRPMTPWKEQVQAHGVPPGHGIQHPRKGSQNNVGKLPWAAGTGNNLQGLSKRGQKAEGGESPTGAAHEPVRAMTEG